MGGKRGWKRGRSLLSVSSGCLNRRGLRAGGSSDCGVSLSPRLSPQVIRIIFSCLEKQFQGYKLIRKPPQFMWSTAADLNWGQRLIRSCVWSHRSRPIHRTPTAPCPASFTPPPKDLFSDKRLNVKDLPVRRRLLASAGAPHHDGIRCAAIAPVPLGGLRLPPPFLLSSPDFCHRFPHGGDKQLLPVIRGCLSPVCVQPSCRWRTDDMLESARWRRRLSGRMGHVGSVHVDAGLMVSRKKCVR